MPDAAGLVGRKREGEDAKRYRELAITIEQERDRGRVLGIERKVAALVRFKAGTAERPGRALGAFQIRHDDSPIRPPTAGSC